MTVGSDRAGGSVGAPGAAGTAEGVVEAVLAMHYGHPIHDGDRTRVDYCQECHVRYPCDTVKVIESTSPRPSFSNPVPLTPALLAEHGGKLPDGTVIRDGDDFAVVREEVDHILNRMRAETGGYVVVHLPESTS